MAGVVDSYSLREVAELLGVSKRTLQRRIQEGAFPGRFLAAGRHGLETRIPAEDLEHALDELRRQGAGWRGTDEPVARSPTASPKRELESLVPYSAYQTPEVVAPSSSAGLGHPSALTQTDLESLRDAMLAIVREDREMFLGAIREALMMRDREIGDLQHELSSVRRALEGVRSGMEQIERRLIQGRDVDHVTGREWAELVLGNGGSRSALDIDAVLKDLGELEAMLAGVDSEG
jgi:excisionase family DNA binding protein